MVEKHGKHVINDINEVCERHRESLATVLSYLCAFGDTEATAVLNCITHKCNKNHKCNTNHKCNKN